MDRATAPTTRCFSCGAEVPAVEGTTHDYMLSSPGCWQTYGEVLAREYRDPAYMSRHQLTVDAYAVQHPGDRSPAATRSVHLHLTSLCAVFERGMQPIEARRLLKRLAEGGFDPEWLEPPEELGEITVADVHATEEVKPHLAAVDRWARSAWEAWSGHHEPILRKVDRLL